MNITTTQDKTQPPAIPSKIALIIFGRYPKPGAVKTRLAATIGNEAATAFFRASIEHIFDEAETIKHIIAPFYFYSDPADQQPVEEWVGQRFPCIVQTNGTLVERNAAAFRYVFNAGYKKAIIVATDIPDLSTTIITEAIRALTKSDAVIGVDQEQGYYLLGMNQLYEHFFLSTYGQGQPLGSQIIHHAKTSGLNMSQLTPLINVNTIDELRAWYQTQGKTSEHPVKLLIDTLQINKFFIDP